MSASEGMSEERLQELHTHARRSVDDTNGNWPREHCGYVPGMDLMEALEEIDRLRAELKELEQVALAEARNGMDWENEATALRAEVERLKLIIYERDRARGAATENWKRDRANLEKERDALRAHLLKRHGCDITAEDPDYFEDELGDALRNAEELRLHPLHCLCDPCYEKNHAEKDKRAALRESGEVKE